MRARRPSSVFAFLEADPELVQRLVDDGSFCWNAKQTICFPELTEWQCRGVRKHDIVISDVINHGPCHSSIASRHCRCLCGEPGRAGHSVVLWACSVQSDGCGIERERRAL